MNDIGGVRAHLCPHEVTVQGLGRTAGRRSGPGLAGGGAGGGGVGFAVGGGGGGDGGFLSWARAAEETNNAMERRDRTDTRDIQDLLSCER